MIKKILNLTIEDIASICDHTFLDRPEAYREKAKEHKEYGIGLYKQALQKFLDDTFAEGKPLPYALCIRPEEVYNVTKHLAKKREEIKIASVVDFPIPNKHLDSLKNEIEEALYWGRVDEIDMVFDYTSLMEGNTPECTYRVEFAKKIIDKANNVRKSSSQPKALLKVILETEILSLAEIKTACQICENAEIDFVKTCTGFMGNATKEALKIMGENFSRGIKISGGVNATNVYDLLEAASGRDDGYIDLDPMRIRIGESSLLGGLLKKGK